MRALVNGSDENVRSERFKLFFSPLVAKDKKNAFRVTVKIFGLCAHFLVVRCHFLKVCHFGKKRNERERKRRYETRTVKLFVFVVLFSRKEERRLQKAVKERERSCCC